MATTPHAPVASPSRAAAGCLGEGVGEWSLEDLFAWHEAGEAAAWVGLLETSAPVGTRGSGWTALVDPGTFSCAGLDISAAAEPLDPTAAPTLLTLTRSAPAGLAPTGPASSGSAPAGLARTGPASPGSAPIGQPSAGLASTGLASAAGACDAGAAAVTDADRSEGLGSVAGELAGMLARLREVSLDGLGAGELVEVITAVEGLRGGVAAVQARATIAFETVMVEEGVAKGWTTRGARRGIGPAVALARRVSPSVGDRWLAFCRRLAHLPATFEALAWGVCSEEAALVVAVETGSVGAGLAGVVDVEMAPVLGTCGTRSLTEQARVLVDTLDPEAAAARCRAAVADRHVVTRVGRDGMGSITVHAPLPQVAAAAEALAIHTSKVCASRETGSEGASRKVSEPGGGGRVPSCGRGDVESESASRKTGGSGDGGQQGEDALSWAQVQADTAITWLSGFLPAAPPPVTVNLVMTPTQLLGRDATPVRVPGYGHIPATLARALITPTPTAARHEDGCALGDPDPGRGDETADRPRRDGQGEGSRQREGSEHWPRAGQRTGRGHAPGQGEGSEDGVEPGQDAGPGIGSSEGAGPGQGTAGDGSCADPTASTWDKILAPLLTAPFPGCEPPADAAVFLRRLFTTADGRDLASMESTARLFPPHLRQFFVLRDDRDRHPYSDAPIRHADHVTSHSEGGPTTVSNGQGLSVRANHVKTLPGWKARTLTEAEVTAYATSTDATDPNGRVARLAGPHTHVVELTTPTGHTYLSTPRPLTG